MAEDVEDPDNVAPISCVVLTFPDGRKEVWEGGRLVETILPPDAPRKV